MPLNIIQMTYGLTLRSRKFVFQIVSNEIPVVYHDETVSTINLLSKEAAKVKHLKYE